MTILPYQEVFRLKTQLQAVSGNYRDVNTIPNASLYPLLAVLSGGRDSMEGTSAYYSVIVYNTSTLQYEVRYIDLDTNSQFVGIQRPLSGNESILRWKYTGNGPLSGTGVLGTYFNTSFLSGQEFKTTYENIDFDSSQLPIVSSGTLSSSIFSAQWNGYLYIPQTGDYKFRIVSNGNSNLWIDSLRIINNTTTTLSSVSSTSTSQTLVQGFTPIQLNYNYYTNSSVIHLQWITPTTSNFTAIPVGSLYSPGYLS